MKYGNFGVEIGTEKRISECKISLFDANSSGGRCFDVLVDKRGSSGGTKVDNGFNSGVGVVNCRNLWCKFWYGGWTSNTFLEGKRRRGDGVAMGADLQWYWLSAIEGTTLVGARAAANELDWCIDQLLLAR